jgi:hypothetical protein
MGKRSAVVELFLGDMGSIQRELRPSGFSDSLSAARPVEQIHSAPSEAGDEAEQALCDRPDSQTRDDIARPMGEKDNSRENQTTTDCPNGISLS